MTEASWRSPSWCRAGFRRSTASVLVFLRNIVLLLQPELRKTALSLCTVSAPPCLSTAVGRKGPQCVGEEENLTLGWAPKQCTATKCFRVILATHENFILGWDLNLVSLGGEVVIRPLHHARLLANPYFLGHKIKPQVCKIRISEQPCVV